MDEETNARAAQSRLRWPAMAVAAAAWLGGAMLAWHHPLYPQTAVLAFTAWCGIALLPNVALVVLPAAVPLANAAPWTGWIAFDEFDLVALGAIGSGHARSAWCGRHHDMRAAGIRWPLVWMGAFAGATLLAALRSIAVQPTLHSAGWFAGYDDPLNSLRVGKSAIYAWLLLPSLREAARRSMKELFRCSALGMVLGTFTVCAAAIWERWAYPGLVDFSAAYRTVALFWEMHVGGAAIDGYLTMGTPFVAWAVMRAARPLRFAAAAMLALMLEYACLTTFSRGVYMAVTASLAMLIPRLARRNDQAESMQWRRWSVWLLATGLLLQAALLFSADSYLLRRVRGSASDLGSRLVHWHNGLGLMKGPIDMLAGIGLGRLPRAYAASAPDGRVPGDAHLGVSPAGPELLLQGPRGARRAGHYAITQRLRLAPGSHRVTVDVRSQRGARLMVTICETHLLFDMDCQRGHVAIEPGEAWQRLEMPLAGPAIPGEGGRWRATLLSLYLPDPESEAEIRSVALDDAIRNGNFAEGLAHWYPLARNDFLPWHIDSLPLELFVERGILGLLSFGFLATCAMRRLFATRNRGLTAAPVLAASLVGALLLGLVSSLLDSPRVAFLLLYLIALSLAWCEAAEPVHET